jgi:hypothetical protein
MRRDWKRTLGLSVVGLLVLTLVVSAKAGRPSGDTDKKGEKKKDETAKKEKTPPPKVEKDEAFEHYVDIDRLAAAWEDQDAGLLTDLGLQLAEGERVLLRSHKGVTATQVLTAAARIAAEKRDTRTLQRLARAAKLLKREGLEEQVRGALKLAKTSRAAEPALKVQLDQADLDDLGAVKAVLDQVSAARLAGDSKVLDLIVKDVPGMDRLTGAQKKLVLNAANEARAALKDSKNDDVADAMNKLSGISRGEEPAAEDRPQPLRPRRALRRAPRQSSPVRRSEYLGITYQPTAKGLAVREEVDESILGSETLNPGDVIVKVGKTYCGKSNGDLDNLVVRAYAAGNKKIVVRDSESGKLKTIELPELDEEDEEGDE